MKIRLNTSSTRDFVRRRLFRFQWTFTQRVRKINFTQVVLVALQAIDTLSKKRSRSSACQSDRVRLFVIGVVHRCGQKIDLGRVGPGAFCLQEIPYNYVVRCAFFEMIRQPIDVLASSKHKERTLIRTYRCARPTFRQIV